MARRDLAREAAIVAAYRNGALVKAIAAKYGITPERVRQLLRQAGEPPRGAQKGQDAALAGRGTGDDTDLAHANGAAVVDAGEDVAADADKDHQVLR